MPQLQMGCPQLRRDCAAVAEDSLIAESGPQLWEHCDGLGNTMHSDGLGNTMHMGVCRMCGEKGVCHVRHVLSFLSFFCRSYCGSKAVDAVVSTVLVAPAVADVCPAVADVRR